MTKQTTKPSATLEQVRALAGDGLVVLEHKLPSGNVFVAETRKGLQQICVLPDGNTFFADRLLAKMKFGATAPTFVGYVTTEVGIPLTSSVVVVPDTSAVMVSEPVVSMAPVVSVEPQMVDTSVVTDGSTETTIVVDEQQVDVVIDVPVDVPVQDVQLTTPDVVVTSVTTGDKDTNGEDYLSLIGETTAAFAPQVVDEVPSFVDFYSDSPTASVVVTSQEEQHQAVLEETPTVVTDTNVVTDVIIKSETIVVPEETKVSEATAVKTEEEEMEELISKGMSALTVEEKKKVIHWQMGRPMEKFLADLAVKHPPYKAPAKSETKPAKSSSWFPW